MLCKTIKVFRYFVLSFLILGCFTEGPDFPAGKVKGYRPIYSSQADAEIAFVDARAVHKPGKIYSYGKYLLVNEQKEGIHVFDNSDPSSPKAVGFLKIYGNVDMAVKNNVLYADYLGSLVALDIRDLNNIVTLSTIKTWTSTVPPETGYYFECIDSKKGEVIGWELTDLNNPTCYK